MSTDLTMTTRRQDVSSLADKLCALLGGEAGSTAVPVSACPRCNGNRFVKNGKDRKDRTRYICRTCGKTFTAFTDTALCGTRQPTAAWKTYVESMLEGCSLEECAQRCGISTRTAFFWRHKTLKAVYGEALPDDYLRANRQTKPTVVSQLLIARASSL